MARTLSDSEQRLRAASITPLLGQIATVILAGAVVIAITLITSDATSGRIDRAANESDAALLAAQMDINEDAVRSYLAAAARGESFSPAVLLDVHDAMRRIDDDAAILASLTGSVRAQELRGSAADTRTYLRNFIVSSSPGDLAQVQRSLNELDTMLESQADELAALSGAHQQAAKRAAHNSEWVVIATAIVAALLISSMSLVVGARMRRTLAQTSRERDELATATATIRKRNDQFSALYQVVGEITDNLSMKYVVTTTVNEAGKLVQADYVELRLLEDDSLTPQGHMQSSESIVAAAEPLPLGIGLAGRAAKRGKTIRLDRGAEAAMAESERVASIESGIVVPLIVGARVVGTLACWSTQPAKFDTDDERILELMATQVATAVAAAGLHATSEARAAHDPLTGLPNRRQLVEDTVTIQQAIDEERKVSVVMLDVDHFKRFNDDFGHRVGDVTLQKVAQVMRGAVRESDQVYRYGGEEFLAVFQDVSQDEALRLTERLRIAVGKTLLTGEQMEPVGPITISAGLASAPESGTDFATLVRLADGALYKSKESGRNRVTVADAVELETVAA